MSNFHDLFTRYASDIYRFALFLCGDEAEAEDITAESIFACPYWESTTRDSYG